MLFSPALKSCVISALRGEPLTAPSHLLSQHSEENMQEAFEPGTLILINCVNQTFEVVRLSCVPSRSTNALRVNKGHNLSYEEYLEIDL